MRDGLSTDNVTLVELALADTTRIVRDLHGEVPATHAIGSVLAEVAADVQGAANQLPLPAQSQPGRCGSCTW